MPFEIIQVDNRPGVRTLTVNRPDKLTAPNRHTLEELRTAFGEAGRDRSVREIVLTGAGDKAFVAGADIDEIRDCTPARTRAFSQLGQELTRSIQLQDKPVIARINSNQDG